MTIPRSDVRRPFETQQTESKLRPALLWLICALPNPGCPGAPQGMFYEDTPEGEKLAKEFSRAQDRPGWGVFYCPNPFRADADLQKTFAWVLEQSCVRGQP